MLAIKTIQYRIPMTMDKDFYETVRKIKDQHNLYDAHVRTRIENNNMLIIEYDTVIETNKMEEF